jgi:phenylacetate-CoA ligase
MGLFQIIRTAREVDRLQLRVGYAADWAARLDGVRDAVRAAVLDATGTEPGVELVPNETLLRLGPPHKIPRVARA